MSSIYNGPSEGFSDLVDGYIGYGEEVIIKRAIPDVRDGQKPVTRRILYTAEKNKTGSWRKCVPVVGDAVALHPHGDGSVYGALCLLTDENGSCNIPFFDGMGNLGKVESSSKPAGMRYPKVKINDYALNDLFKDKDVMELVPSEEADDVEPKVLNAVYPVVLVNGANGIAVSTGTRMASFNLIDVLDLTIKYIKQGRKLNLSDIIIPDFPTGGVLVCNTEEITKIMATGKGKLKIRAKVEIEGSSILVKEVPFGKTIEGIKKACNESGIDGLNKAIITRGKDSDALITIICKNKRVTEQVLLRLYNSNILQNYFSSNILVIDDGKPKILGVHGIIDCWYEYRVPKLREKFTKLIAGVQAEKEKIKYVMELVKNTEVKEAFGMKMMREGKAAGRQYLYETLGYPMDICSWLTGLSLDTFHDGGSFKTRYNNICNNEQAWSYNLSHIDEYIINELTEIRNERAGAFPRKTEVTYKDYKFSRITDSDEVEDESFCVYTVLKNGFIKKTRNVITGDDVMFNINARANSVLIGFDNMGRVLRVLGKEIPYTGISDNGVYLPKYFGVDDPDKYNYKILYLCLLDGSKKTLIYRDGYIGFFDTNEYLGKKNIKIISRGVCTAVNDKLLHIYEENEVPDYLLLADNSHDKLRIGVVVMEEVPERSHTSRAKVLSGTDINTEYLKGFKRMGLAKFIEDPNNYVGRLKIFKGEFYGDPEEVLEGAYLGICKDLD